jgi:tetratricopeptide (TPR) repeat protein
VHLSRLQEGKLDDAMELYGKALEIYKKTLGEDHTAVAGVYENMTKILESQGKLDDAMELHRKALKIRANSRIRETDSMD